MYHVTLTLNCVAYIWHARYSKTFYGIFIGNFLVFVLYREVSRQNISKFTTNTCFHGLTKRLVEPYDFRYQERILHMSNYFK